MLKGKTAIITGGSRGIGRAIALAMADQGARIIIIYAGNQAQAEKTCSLIQEKGIEAKAYCCDVADFAAAQKVTDEIIASWGEIDILVNNAGIICDGLVLAMQEAEFDQVLATNLKGAFNMIKHLYKPFMKRRGGRIINISSVVGLTGNAGQANYAAAKAGLIGLTKSVARELAGRRVTCNVIAPGFIATDMTNSLTDKVKESTTAAIPMKRMGKPEEVAALAVFLASDQAGYITGEVIKVDGGLCM
jgi:3-oxoacyl-[acyl-carrier protein] reductase